MTTLSIYFYSLLFLFPPCPLSPTTKSRNPNSSSGSPPTVPPPTTNSMTNNKRYAKWHIDPLGIPTPSSRPLIIKSMIWKESFRWKIAKSPNVLSVSILTEWIHPFSPPTYNPPIRPPKKSLHISVKSNNQPKISNPKYSQSTEFNLLPESLSRKSSLNKFNSKPNSKTLSIKKFTMSTPFPSKLSNNFSYSKKSTKTKPSNLLIIIKMHLQAKRVKTLLNRKKLQVNCLPKTQSSVKGISPKKKVKFSILKINYHA